MPAAPAPKNEISGLETLYSYSILDSLLEQAIDDITELARFICETQISVISLVDSDRQSFKSKVGLHAAETTR